MVSRAAYVVLTHDDPDQVTRLVDAIRASSPSAHVFVSHDDRRAPPPSFTDPAVLVRAHGLPTDWGSWELVEATLDAFAWAREVADPDLVALISGRDYPARDLESWEQHVVSTEGGWVGDVRPLAYSPRWGRRLGEGEDDLTRYTYRWVHVPSVSRRLPHALAHGWSRVRTATALRVEPVVSYRVLARGRGSYLGLRRMRTPFSRERPAYKGSQWLALDRQLLDHLLDRVRTGPLTRLYRTSVIPDESMIQTALTWVQPPRAGERLSYVEWDVAADSPRTMTLEDLPSIRQSGAPFCRKVDLHLSGDLLDVLDGENGVTERRRPGPASR